ncbi:MULTISPECIES: fluoride efflux transporter CrcB [Weeksellaceae]|uniref:fluoride efflux transporter CrcB n=1 Tax=Weeksellaceae TaxID=2762318 RepID=UPI001629241E|nr:MULTISPECIES: fluoride efflux transporter CrcB [Weeksellaceae]MCT3639632.1 fluoride efflux transporter CrcB [Elizabethkingia anophelis]MDE5470516.1 fluoride efflux transporter CrcB [Elizabethkingia meningoseptica]MDE5492754.1 fluoride efflux transporter CrcB [Elizabethkingia meningoseptica]
MKWSFFLIGLGGAVGSICRYLLQLLVRKYWATTFPIGTFAVNILGCFVIGILYGLFAKYNGIAEEWRLLLIVGICGGFTTFSSFSYESIVLFRNGDYLYFFTYVSLSVIIGLLATFLGMIMIK